MYEVGDTITYKDRSWRINTKIGNFIICRGIKSDGERGKQMLTFTIGNPGSVRVKNVKTSSDFVKQYRKQVRRR